MEKAILLSLIASVCTATSSICQRIGAKGDDAAGFDLRLLWRLAGRPVWLLGLASMILGFAFQVSALQFGPLALVQPILALELLFVFAFMAFLGRSKVTVRPRDWLAAVAMSAGIGCFLRGASPSGGRPQAPASMWWPVGLVTFGLVGLSLTAAYGPLRRHVASGPRRAAVLGAATGISWGFVAAVIKELSSRLGESINATMTSWPLYVLIVTGAATLVLSSHALAAGPLAASQPGFTILDPLWASLLGLFLFNEHFQAGALDLLLEALALAVIVAGVAALSHSNLIAGEDEPPPAGTTGHRPPPTPASDQPPGGPHHT